MRFHSEFPAFVIHLVLSHTSLYGVHMRIFAARPHAEKAAGRPDPLRYSDPDPLPRRRQLLQKSISVVKCTRAKAKARRDELAVSIRRNEFVAPTKLTLGEWLRIWVEDNMRPVRRMNTLAAYQNAITRPIVPAPGESSSRRSDPHT